MALDELAAVRHQRPRQRRRKPEHGDSLALDQRPQPVGRRPVRSALCEQHRAAEGVPAHHFPGAHDPAHVRHEVNDLARLRVGLIGDLARDRDQEPALDVDDPFRPPGRAGRVGEQVRMLGVDLERLQRPGPLHHLGVEEVPAWRHRDVVAAEPAPDDDVLDRGRLANGVVDDLLHRHLASASQRTVGSDDHLCFGVLQPLCDRWGGEAGEDRHLHGADVRARVRDDRDLGRHRQEEGDPVARFDAERHERLRETRHPLGKLPVGEPVTPAVLRFPERGRHLRRALGPAMHAVPGEVELAADEPGRPFRPTGEVDDPVPRLRELQPHVVDRCRPEPFRILRGSAL